MPLPAKQCRPALLALALLLPASAFAQAQPQLRFAVMTIKPSGKVTQDDADIIGARLRVDMFKTGKVVMMEREEMSSILKEQGFQKSGACNDQQCLVEMGQLLGVQFLVNGSIGTLNELLLLNFRVIDVQKGVISNVVARDIKGGLEKVVSELPGIARELVTANARQAQPEPKPAPQPSAQPAQAPAAPQPAPAAAAPAAAGETAVQPAWERKVRFILTTDAVFMYGNSREGGPALQTGLEIKKHHYVGLRLDLAVGTIYADASDLAPDTGASWSKDFDEAICRGIGLVYGYTFNVRNILLITPAATLGYWKETVTVDYWDYSAWESYNAEKSDFYLGGLLLRLQLGYKWVFLNSEISLLFGSGGVKRVTSFGMAVRI